MEVSKSKGIKRNVAVLGELRHKFTNEPIGDMCSNDNWRPVSWFKPGEC